MSEVLTARDLTLSYPRSREHVFEELTLTLRAGEVVSVLGQSGVGKSSLLRVLAGLVAPQRGEVRVRGERVAGPSPQVALAFQDARLLPWLSLEENVRFGLDFRRSTKLSRHERRARVDAAIEHVGLSHARRKAPSELSGGMAQRAAFARCLARHPDVLLLDEPFAALDEVTRRDMQTLVLELARTKQTAILLSTHDIDEALRLSDRILLLRGRPARLAHTWTLEARSPARTADTRADIVRALEALDRRALSSNLSHKEEATYV